MTAKNGRLESVALVVPTGGWSFDFTDGDGAHTGTVAAGTYSPTTLHTAFIAQLNAQSANAYTGSIANGEAASGAATFVNADADVTAVTWTSTDLRDALGFSAALPGTGTELGPRTFTGLYGMRGLWLPDCVRAGLYVSGDEGHLEGGPTQTISPQGVVKTITRPTRTKCGPFRWTAVSLARARKYSEAASGGVTARSFERFIRDTMFAEVSYFTPGGKVRLYWDADNSSAYVEMWPKAPADTSTTPLVQEWAGLYSLQIEGWKA